MREKLCITMCFKKYGIISAVEQRRIVIFSGTGFGLDDKPLAAQCRKVREI